MVAIRCSEDSATSLSRWLSKDASIAMTRPPARAFAKAAKALLSLGAESEEKREPVSDIDTGVVDLTNGCYRLLLHNQNRLFLLRPLKGAPAADLPLLILPWDQIEQIRVLPDHTSCE